MRDAEPRTIRLTDYTPPVMQIQTTDLTFDIHPGVTTVTSRLQVRRVAQDGASTLELDGQELELLSVAVDGLPLADNEYQLDDNSLTLFDLPDRCEVVIQNRIHPEDNTALEGLYKSGTMYCTQCEAEGFRKITYYQDRPDVLATFTTSIIAAADYPVLLSNGNPILSEEHDDGRRKVTWQDPFPKPSYLFALVAGDLALLSDHFVTMSGRDVELRIYSEPHNIEQCHYAMDVLKRSMRWDEERFGREYDLDIFMIVAVEDFNMGAMENKGLNIFNTSCVLATPDTATDLAYQRVEGVVAHEYFHNWSGNRVTCRDWFQLSLKEGFTVFRDAEFSSDMNSRTVKRIEDVNFLRAVQFAEDASPLAHPIRPDSYIEISNFYTPTVYEKGAEVIRMLHTLVGEEAFRRGSDLYFERHDGQAATTDDFLVAMAEASGKDLSQFERWYHQAGTPVLEVKAQWSDDELTLSVSQSCPATPGQPEKQPLHVPVALGFVDAEGRTLAPADLMVSCDALTERREDSLLLHLQAPSTTLTLTGLATEPQVSFLRGFSAPVKVDYPRGAEQLAFLATHDGDGFAAWDAMQTLQVDEISSLAERDQVADIVIELYRSLLAQALQACRDGTAEECFMLAAKLTLPDENNLFERAPRVDVDRVCNARDALKKTLGAALADGWQSLYAGADAGPYAPDAIGMGRRGLRNLALGYLSECMDGAELGGVLEAHYSTADNLTDRRAALFAALNSEQLDRMVIDRLISRFYADWGHEALVVNQWFAAQASSRLTDAQSVRALAAHPAFELKNPNKVRAVYSAFAHQNLRHFHGLDGTGYELVGDVVIALNDINPQMASALAKPLTRWRRISGGRAALMQKELERIAGTEGLSSDLFEVVEKSLAR